MKAEVQLPIEGIPYAFAKYHVDLEDMKQIHELHEYITKDVKSAPVKLTEQNSLEIEKMRELLDDAVEKSEMKSRIIEALKNKIGEDEFSKLRDEVISSPEFKAITKHKPNGTED